MKLKIALLAAAMTMATAANATLFTVKWDGTRSENGASAIGHFNFSATPADLGGSQPTNNFPSPNVQLIDLTITGASAGNGTFTEADFSSFYFASFSQLDLTHELIGQSLTNGCTFGDFGACYGGPSGDFNLFSAGGSAPNGSFYFQLSTAGGEAITVSSIAPSVPEPASWALLIAGFGLTGAAMRRRRTAIAA